MKAGAEALVLKNPAWSGVPGLVHGVNYRRVIPQNHRIELSEAVLPLRAAGLAPDWPAWGADQTHEDQLRWAPQEESDATPLVFQDAPENIYEFGGVDALATAKPETLLIIRTADCLPLFMFDAARRVVALAHCGWRSMEMNMAAITAGAMIARGSSAGDLRAWIGPCIRTASFEVGPEIVLRFEAKWPEAKCSPDGVHLDLAAVAKEQLRLAGLAPGQIDDSGACTFEESENYHSFRRDGEASGRMASFIGWHVRTA